jgi:hypothetical protein
MMKGVNYPRGPLAWGNELGLERVLAEIERLRAESGESGIALVHCSGGW